MLAIAVALRQSWRRDGLPVFARRLHVSLSPWREVVPESPHRVLQSINVARRTLVLSTLERVKSQLQLVDVSTKATRTVVLPTLGQVSSVSTFGSDHEEFFFTFTSLMNRVVYRQNARTGKQAVWWSTRAGSEDDIAASQVWYPSKDGTQVPMFVFHKKGMRLEGDRPTLLSALWGYGAITFPFCNREAATWVRAGGVYAFANIRGGGELGDNWHKDGMLAKKQNGFDDFIAAAEWLIAHKYTRAERLAIAGVSNGGMLVAVAAVQRPELFRAVVSRVPHLDMVRYHRFLAAAPWVTEFGSPDVKEEFEYLYRYSPYHNVKDGTAYPAMMFVTGDADTTVAPLHARKMTARVQAASSSGRPVLLLYDVQTGHGGGGSVSMTPLDFWTSSLSSVRSLGLHHPCSPPRNAAGT